jgi:7,8-dihydropterin-6-yl-methyl-4-(beta-D-ribofuranosyl)aminobenzene 5'-phosphate synthase
MRDETCLKSMTITVTAEDSVEYESALLGQHGISFFIHAEAENGTRNIVVDVGQNTDALLHNMEQLGIAPESTDMIVLTHCHYDHTQGLSRFIRRVGKKDIPVVAHPGIFRVHFVTEPFLRHVGVMSGDAREKIEDAGGRLFLTRDPLRLMPGMYTSGEIERKTDFEDPGIALKTLDDGRIQDDLVMDDLSLIACVEKKGSVVITGCSHAGIVNIVRHAVKLSGKEKIAGIAGGFHLIEATEQKIRKTVEALAEFDIGWIAGGHCTGFRAQSALYGRFGERFIPLHSGQIFRL